MHKRITILINKFVSSDFKRRFQASLIVLLLILIPLRSSTTEVSAQVDTKRDQIEEITAKKLDKEAEILQKYLARYNSPLQYHAQDFIDAAETYNLDWKMLPAIAGVESTFGKFIPGGYNAWGWGVYGTQAIYFDSWRDAIFTISQGLRENYLNRGYTEPYSMNRIYAASPHWGAGVSYFMNDLDKFATQFKAEQTKTHAMTLPKIAAVSGQLIIGN